MAWLRDNWRWAVLNGCGVLTVAFVLGRGSMDWNAKSTFDPMLESGKWAIRFLLFCLAMTPLNMLFRWRQALKLRKSAGLWAFAFAALHIWLLAGDRIAGLMVWLELPLQTFIVFGLFAVCVLALLAVTSNRWAMKHLGKRWKLLHRAVYLAASAAIYHAILASSATKKMLVRDPQAIHELKLYAVVLAVLLVVRIPLVRRLPMYVKQVIVRAFAKRQRPQIIAPVGMPDLELEKVVVEPPLYQKTVESPVLSLEEYPLELRQENEVENREKVASLF